MLEEGETTLGDWLGHVAAEPKMTIQMTSWIECDVALSSRAAGWYADEEAAALAAAAAADDDDELEKIGKVAAP